MNFLVTCRGSKIRSVLLFFCLHMLTLVSGQKHGVDTSVCNPATIKNSASPTLPSLPSQYRLTVEANFEDKNYTTDVTEYYDQPNRRAAIHQWEFGFHISNIFSYTTNQMITVEDQTGTCAVDQLSTDSDDFLFGYQTSSKNPNVGKMFSAYGALRFGGNYSEQYMGTTTIRGMLCDHWKSCMYWKSNDATMMVDTYFTSPSWDSPITPRTPVRCSVHGNIWEQNVGGNLAPRKFNHTYEFSEFSSVLPDVSQIFETPPGIVCLNRTDTRPLPKPSGFFRFTSEVLNPGMKTIGFIKEWYDFNMSLVRYDYKPQPLSIAPYGYDFLSEVHDFSEGVSYIRDPAKGNCSAVPISGVGFDARFVDATHVRIRNPAEFFYFDNTNYQYTGVKRTRGIDCDVWIGLRQDWPPEGPVNSTWEWYFALNDWMQSTGHIYEFGMPVQLRLTAIGIGSFIYNMYDYDEEQPKIFDFDISTCYNVSEKRDFSFKINAKYQDTVAKNVEIFKYMVLLEVHKWSGVSPMRITNVNVDYDATHVIVSFTVLGPAPIVGDVTHPVKQVDLYTASTLLNDSINKGDFQVVVDYDKLTDTATYIASPYTLTTANISTVDEYYTPPAPQKTTYTAGQLAGLGVGMLVLFFIAGFIGVFLFFRNRNSAAGGAQTLSSDKGLENPTYENEKGQ